MEGVTYSLPLFWRTDPGLKANLSGTPEGRFGRCAEVDRDWRRQLPGLPFRARPSTRNEPILRGQRFLEDRLHALLVESGDTMQRPPPSVAPPLPFEQMHFRMPARLELEGTQVGPGDFPPF